jgi:hypothetical protein
MTRYAESTAVSSETSRGEIERTLARYGASSFMYGWDHDKAIVAFVANERQVRFSLPMPSRDSREFTHTAERGLKRTATAAAAAYDQAVRQRWRALNLVIKAKLEAVETGIVTFEQEFGMHYMLPSGETVGEWLSPQLAQVYLEGKQLPALLPGSGS